MNHKGVEYTIAMTDVIAMTDLPAIWNWQFRTGDSIISRRTKTRINLLAIRRVQLRIDRELNAWLLGSFY